MTPNTYLARLLDLFLSLPQTRYSPQSPSRTYLHRLHLSSLSSCFSPPVLALLGTSPAAIINCTGLGAATLTDISDPTVFPIRGQVVRIHAPWVKQGYTRQIGSLDGGEGGERTYVIPRGNGDVILGGTREVGDWKTRPRSETTDDILRRTLEICPELVPGGESIEDKLARLRGMVEQEVVGFRPQRTGGVRLERGADIREGENTAVVVHNYGHGGAGWQSCWGCAEDVVALLTREGGIKVVAPKAKL